jgi:hypothetical protein
MGLSCADEGEVLFKGRGICGSPSLKRAAPLLVHTSAQQMILPHPKGNMDVYGGCFHQIHSYYTVLLKLLICRSISLEN